MQKQIELKNLCFGYEKILLKNAFADLNSGEIAVLIGENGAGKSTLIQCLLKQKSLIEGDIILMGKNLKSFSNKDLAKTISIVYSKSSFSEQLRLFDVVALGKFHLYPYYFKLNKKDVLEVETIIEEMGLGQYKEFPLSALSDGNLQKTFIARALAQDTPIIILDEPTTHLDDKNKTIVHDILQKLAAKNHKSILFSSHDWRSSQHISNWVWYLENQELKTSIFEDFKQNQLITSYENEVLNPQLPKMIGSISETKEMIDFINKNKFNHLSNIEVRFENQQFRLINSKQEILLNSWSDLKEYFLSIRN